MRIPMLLHCLTDPTKAILGNQSGRTTGDPHDKDSLHVLEFSLLTTSLKTAVIICLVFSDLLRNFPVSIFRSGFSTLPGFPSWNLRELHFSPCSYCVCASRLLLLNATKLESGRRGRIIKEIVTAYFQYWFHSSGLWDCSIDTIGTDTGAGNLNWITVEFPGMTPRQKPALSSTGIFLLFQYSEVSPQIEFNFFPFETEIDFHTPYLFRNHVFSFQSESWTERRSFRASNLGTEGQNFNGTKPYKRIQLAIPIGGESK